MFEFFGSVGFSVLEWFGSLSCDRDIWPQFIPYGPRIHKFGLNFWWSENALSIAIDLGYHNVLRPRSICLLVNLALDPSIIHIFFTPDADSHQAETIVAQERITLLCDLLLSCRS